MSSVSPSMNPMAASGIHDKVLEMALPMLAGKQILVAGSGEGAFELRLLEQGIDSSQITSLDINPAQFKVQGLECAYCDLNRPTPFADRSYDIWISIEVIEHLRDPQNLIDEAHRVLRDDGVLFITTPNVDSLDQRLRYLLSGRFFWFRDKDHDNLGHLHPIFHWLFKWMIRDKFEIVRYEAPRFRLKLLSKGPGLPVPWRGSLFADINVYMLRKLPRADS